MAHCQVANLLEKVSSTVSLRAIREHHTQLHFYFFFEQMSSSDKDFRFMATTDLMTELQKSSIKLDDEIERKIVKMLLNLLEDKNGEVQNLAVKW